MLAQLTERHGVRFVTVLLVVDDEVVVLGRRRINRLAIKPTRTQLCQPLTQQRRCELFRQRFLLQCLVWVDAVALQHARQQLVVVDADAQAVQRRPADGHTEGILAPRLVSAALDAGDRGHVRVGEERLFLELRT